VLGRTVQASVKITAVEQQLLRDKFGGVPRGLRAGLDLLLHAEPEQVVPAKRPARGGRPKRYVEEPPMPPPEVLAQMDPLVPDVAVDGLDIEQAASADPWAQARDAASGAAPHRHRRGEKLNEVFEHGTPIRTYRCAVPGCTTTLTA
jgi:hypothetical protein